MANSSAESILDRLTASNIFNLRGVVAVVTGGGTVSAGGQSTSLGSVLNVVAAGHRLDDQYDPRGKWRYCIHSRTRAGEA